MQRAVTQRCPVGRHYCEVSEKINDGGGCDEEDEHIEIVEMTWEDVDWDMNYGKFQDAKTIMAIQVHRYTEGPKDEY